MKSFSTIFVVKQFALVIGSLPINFVMITKSTLIFLVALRLLTISKYLENGIHRVTRQRPQGNQLTDTHTSQQLLLYHGAKFEFVRENQRESNYRKRCTSRICNRELYTQFSLQIHRLGYKVGRVMAKSSPGNYSEGKSTVHSFVVKTNIFSKNFKKFQRKNSRQAEAVQCNAITPALYYGVSSLLCSTQPTAMHVSRVIGSIPVAINVFLTAIRFSIHK